jgi:hypothetical protein
VRISYLEFKLRDHVIISGSVEMLTLVGNTSLLVLHRRSGSLNQQQEN